MERKWETPTSIILEKILYQIRTKNGEDTEETDTYYTTEQEEEHT